MRMVRKGCGLKLEHEASGPTLEAVDSGHLYSNEVRILP